MPGEEAEGEGGGVAEKPLESLAGLWDVTKTHLFSLRKPFDKPGGFQP